MKYPGLVSLYIKAYKHIEGEFLAQLCQLYTAKDATTLSDELLFQRVFDYCSDNTNFRNVSEDAALPADAERILAEHVDDHDYLMGCIEKQAKPFLIELIRRLVVASTMVETIVINESSTMHDIFFIVQHLHEVTTKEAYLQAHEQFGAEDSQCISVALLRLMHSQAPKTVEAFAEFTWLIDELGFHLIDNIDNEMAKQEDHYRFSQFNVSMRSLDLPINYDTAMVDDPELDSTLAFILRYVDPDKTKCSAEMQLKFIIKTLTDFRHYDSRLHEQVEHNMRIKIAYLRAITHYYGAIDPTIIENIIAYVCSQSCLSLGDAMDACAHFIRQLQCGTESVEHTTFLSLADMARDYKGDIIPNALATDAFIEKSTPMQKRLFIYLAAKAKKHRLLTKLIHEDVHRDKLSQAVITILSINVPTGPDFVAYQSYLPILFNAEVTPCCLELSDNQVNEIVKANPDFASDEAGYLLKRYTRTAIFASKKPLSLNGTIFTWQCVFQDFEQKERLFLLLCRNPRAQQAMLASQAVQQARPAAFINLYLSLPRTIRNKLLPGVDTKDNANITRANAERMFASEQPDQLMTIYRLLINAQFKTLDSLLAEFEAIYQNGVRYPFPDEYALAHLQVADPSLYLKAFIFCVAETMMMENRQYAPDFHTRIQHTLKQFMSESPDLVRPLFQAILQHPIFRTIIFEMPMVSRALSSDWILKMELTHCLSDVFHDLLSDLVHRRRHMSSGRGHSAFGILLSLFSSLSDSSLIQLIKSSRYVSIFVLENIADVPQQVMAVLYLNFDTFNRVIGDDIAQAHRMVTDTRQTPKRLLDVLKSDDSEQGHVRNTFLRSNELLRHVLTQLEPDEAFDAVFNPQTEHQAGLPKLIVERPCQFIIAHLLKAKKPKQKQLLSDPAFQKILHSKELKHQAIKQLIAMKYQLYDLEENSDKSYNRCIRRALSLILDDDGCFQTNEGRINYFQGQNAALKSKFMSFREKVRSELHTRGQPHSGRNGFLPAPLTTSLVHQARETRDEQDTACDKP